MSAFAPWTGSHFKHDLPTRKRTKGRKDRAEAKVKKAVRAECVERDGDCRIGDWENNPNDTHDDALTGDGQMPIVCEGRSEWAHLGEKKRFKTRKQAPAVRHTTAGSLMLCHRHHQDYDRGRMVIDGNDANGVLGFRYREAKRQKSAAA